jgi:hypothetical protein
MQLAAKVISWLFQPLLMPLFGTLIFLNLPFYHFNLLPDKVYWYILVCISLFTFVMPVLLILLMLKMGIIRDLELSHKEDRNMPLLITLMLHGANYYFLSKINLPQLYMLFLLSGLISLLVTAGITRFWKISMHMTGVGGLMGALLLCALFWAVDMRLYIAAVAIVAGLIGSARLQLKAHTPAQIGMGFIAGLLPQLLVVIVGFLK